MCAGNFSCQRLPYFTWRWPSTYQRRDQEISENTNLSFDGCKSSQWIGRWGFLRNDDWLSRSWNWIDFQEIVSDFKLQSGSSGWCNYRKVSIIFFKNIMKLFAMLVKLFKNRSKLFRLLGIAFCFKNNVAWYLLFILESLYPVTA